MVFPGMELTLGVPCQALLIFDADFPDDLFALAMTALAITPSAETDAKIATVHRLNGIQSLGELKQKLDEHEYLRASLHRISECWRERPVLPDKERACRKVR